MERPGADLKTLSSNTDVHEIRLRLSALTAADERQWGRMSVDQMVCHVRDAFALAAGERTALPVKTAMPRPVMKWLALSFPMRWPKGYATVPELKPAVGATDLAACADGFARNKEGLLARYGRFLEGPCASVHPILGPMSRRDWMRWGYLHTDHHLRQFGR